MISWDASSGPLKAKAHFIHPLATIYGRIAESSMEGECEGFDGDRVLNSVEYLSRS